MSNKCNKCGKTKLQKGKYGLSEFVRINPILGCPEYRFHHCKKRSK